jgi:hypothetical protein
MQILDSKDLLNRLVNKVKESDYEYNTFKFFVKVPLSIAIRQRYIMCLLENHIKQTHPQAAREMMAFFESTKEGVDIKTTIKWIMAPLIAERLQVRSNLNDSFIMNLDFENALDEQHTFMVFEEAVKRQQQSFFEKKMLMK